MARRSGLGKGLGALIPNEVVGDRSSALLDIPVTAIQPNPFQPRTSLDEDTLAALHLVDPRAVEVLQRYW